MPDVISAYEPALRLGAFLLTAGAMAGWEAWAPRRWRALSRWTRWPVNFGFIAVNTVLARLLFPAAAVGAALWAAERQIGLFHWAAVPQWMGIALSVVLLDLLIYGQHVVMHKVPQLWCLPQLMSQ